MIDSRAVSGSPPTPTRKAAPLRTLTVAAALVVLLAVPAAASADVSRKSLSNTIADHVAVAAETDPLNLGLWNGTDCVAGLGGLTWEERNFYCRLVGIGAFDSSDGTKPVRRKHLARAVLQVQYSYNIEFPDSTTYLAGPDNGGSYYFCDVHSGNVVGGENQGIGFMYERGIDDGRSGSCGREYDPGTKVSWSGMNNALNKWTARAD